MAQISLAALSPRELREICRSGAFHGPTAGLAAGYVQANLVMLPGDMAGEFKRFCDLNTGPCPLLEVTQPGAFEPRSAPGADLRTDLPKYRVYRRGELLDQPKDLLRYCAIPNEKTASASSGDHATQWVSFLLGCSFTFESALLKAGIPVRHIEQGRNVPMFRTNVECRPAGKFFGPMVVSMRPMTMEQARRTEKITQNMPGSHGGPVHIGDPAAIGIRDVRSPDYGDAVEIRADETPVFWACGVTPLEAILRAKPDVAIVHEPGHMFVTDLRA